MNAHFAADSTALVSPDCVRETIQKVLRSAQTRFTDEELSRLSGVDARAIKSYRVEGREPSLSRALSLLSVLGRQDLNRILECIGYVARPLDESDLKPCNEALAVSITSLGIFATCAADGRIDHTEKHIARAAADDAIDALIPYSSVAEAV